MSEIQRLPRHVAIIMDGNGRWAKAHKVQIALGHRRGVEALRGIIRDSSHMAIEALSIFAFSTENWTRSEQEVAALMALLLEFFVSEIDELDRENVRIRILGDKEGLPQAQRECLARSEERTKNNTGLQLNIAVNYGSRSEILRAVKSIAQAVRDGKLAPEEINENIFRNALYTNGLPDVDLLIRTSGEKRLSNFLLYQCSYAELAFPDELWPDFTTEHYHRILLDYSRRDRRYGGRSE